jgi:uncharacterized protein YndB with AHSA1/START domain
MTAAPVVVEATFKAPLDKVWKAITDSDQMRQWFFDAIPDFKPQRGFATSFNVHHESTDYLHQWTVTEVEPSKKVEYRWRYGGVPGDSTVTWNLSETPQGTKLRLTHAGIESFPQENPAFRRESCQGGWEYFIRDRLQNYLGG